jgi:sodium/proline symporter
MIIGAVTVIVWKQFAWLGLYEIIPGFIFGSVGSWCSACWVKHRLRRCKTLCEADAHYHWRRRQATAQPE